jgi:5-methylcytosine-specific restriction protein B
MESDILEFDIKEEKTEKYLKDDFERDVLGTDVVELLSILEYKKNIILQGAPGVGKTFIAKRLAWAMMGEKDNSRIAQIQFHQSYEYEDFVMGLKPDADGRFKVRTGVFYNICKKAEKSNAPHFLIIDEINRGNISRILGEMFSLIEKEYRGETIMLKENNEEFSVPKNLYIIGTMNTADRAIELVDYALRRRFAFVSIEPKLESEGFKRILVKHNSIMLNRVVKELIALNKEIEDDPVLGKGFMIGHGYFCGDKVINDESISNTIKYEIIPTLEEYWFDSGDKVETWKQRLINAITVKR